MRFGKNLHHRYFAQPQVRLGTQKITKLQHLTSALARYFFRIAQNPNVFEIQNLEKSSNQE